MPSRVPAAHIRRRAVHYDLVQEALRALNIDLLERGASAEQLGRWLWGAQWFPHLRYDERILALARSLPAEWQMGTFCDPQILLQFPHVGPEPEITFHLDQEPEWAAGRRYLRIVGVALSYWARNNGGLLIKRNGKIEPIELEPGDAVMMTPDVLHSGGINHTGGIRYAVYFRYLSDG